MERFSYPIKRENFFFPVYKNPVIPVHFSLFRFWLDGKKKMKDEIMILNSKSIIFLNKEKREETNGQI